MSNDLISFLDTKAMTNNWENSINPSCPRPAFDCSNVTVIPQSECETLVALYDSTN